MGNMDIELDNNIRALFVNHTAEKGGAELFLLELFTMLPSNWGALFLAEGPIIDDLSRINANISIVKADSKLLSIKRGASWRSIIIALAALMRTSMRVAMLAKGYSVIVANSQKSLFVSAFASARLRIPLVWILHDLLDSDSFGKFTRYAAVFFANSFATRVLANSAATAEAFIKCGGKKEIVHVCYNGFDINRFRPRSVETARNIRQELNLDERPIVAIFGRIVSWKGHHILLEAIRDCPNVQALIVGGAIHDDGEYEQIIKTYCSENGILNRVCFTGFREDVVDIMRDVDIIVHASVEPEPFGRVIVEAMLSRTPIVASDAGGVKEILTNGSMGFTVEPGNVKELVNAINRLINDPGEAAHMVEHAYSNAVECFDLERQAEKFKLLIAETCKADAGSKIAPNCRDF